MTPLENSNPALGDSLFKMIKKLLIMLLFLLFLPFVNAAANLTAADATATWVRGIDTSVETTFTVNNTGDTNLTSISFSVGNLSLSNGTQLTETIANPSTVSSLTSGSSQNVTVTITGVPSTQSIGAYTGNITTTYGSNTTTSTLTITVADPSYSLNTATIAFPLVTTPNSTISTTFSIQNTGNAPLTNVNLSSSAASTYNLTFNETAAFSLAKNAIRDIKVDVFVPYEETVGNHSMGTVSVLSDQQNFTSAYTVYLDVEAKLNIDDLDILVDDKTESNVEDGEKVDEKAEPGSEIELKFRLKNTFSEDSEIDINDITITATLIDPDDEEIEEIDVDVGDLDANEKSDEESILFELPLDVEEGKYTIEIVVEGTDDNEVDHKLEWKVYFDLDKRSHDVIIYKAYLTPEKVKCTRTSSLYVKLMNIGSKTEDEARLTIINDDLDINIDKKDIELSKNPDSDENTYVEEVAINAKDTVIGSYPIVIRAYYEEDLLDDIKTVELVVEGCPEAAEKEETEETVVVVQEPEAQENVTVPVAVGEEIPTTTEISFMQSTSGVIFLILGNIVVLVVVIFLIAKLLVIPKLPPKV